MKKSHSLTLLVIFFWGWTINASAKTHEIIWTASVSPPFHIVDGELAHQGVCDALVESFKAAMPDLQHRVEYLPQLRIGMLWEKEQNLCFPCMIYRDDDPYTLITYSEPTHVYPSHGIITRPQLVDEIIQKYGNPVNLEAMLRDQKYRFIQPVGRMYGDLQPLIDDHLIGTSQHVILNSDNANTAMLSMILRERSDYTIDYPMIKTYYEQMETGELAFLPIAELIGEEVLGAVACTRNSWGEESIRYINQVIPEIQANPNFQRSVKQWLDPIQP